MGFSTVVAFSVVMVSFVMVTGIVVSVAVEKFKEVHEAYQEEKRELLKELRTDFEILSITATKSGKDNHTLEVVVENTGNELLKTEGFTLMVDGKLYPFTADRANLYPGTTATLTAINLPGGKGTSHTLRVVAENGLARYDSYTVG
jgi:archaellum component FlaF (FlaF/FlaG flagellin family)